jgi:hypothetical protein
MKMKIIGVTEHTEFWFVTVETRTGRRYLASYSKWGNDYPTNEMIMDDWKDNRSSFRHVN